MRRYEVRLSPADGAFHPIEGAVRAAAGVDPVAIHRLHRVEPGRGHGVFEFAATSEGGRASLAELFDPFDHELHEVDGRIVVDSPVELGGTTGELLGVVEEADIFLEMPVRYVGQTDLRATVLAREPAFEAARAAVPEAVEVTLEKKREYRPRETPFLSELTPTQRRVFEAAVELDYYGATRGATYEEVGEVVGLSGATVGEHLRKIERTLVEHAL